MKAFISAPNSYKQSKNSILYTHTLSHSLCLPIHVYTYLSIYIDLSSVFLWICTQSLTLFVYLSMSIPIYLSISLSLLFVYWSICLYLPIRLYIHIFSPSLPSSLSFSFCLFLSLSVSISLILVPFMSVDFFVFDQHVLFLARIRVIINLILFIDVVKIFFFHLRIYAIKSTQVMRQETTRKTDRQ